jgi:hypothetical protein
MIDWNKVLSDVVAEAARIVGTRWPSVATFATIQLTAMVENGKEIERRKDSMTDLEYRSAQAGQKIALKMILCTSAAISTVIAEQVAEAAWNIVLTALRTLPELAPFV